MILGIMGTPGAFKTAYTVQDRIVKFLKDKRPIYTNIKGLKPYHIATFFDLDPFDCENLIRPLGRVYRNDVEDSFYEDPNRVRNFHKEIPPGSVVIIDEAQDYFSSRDFKEGYSKDLIPWLSKCRHENFDVIWITPNFDNVDITFRRTTHMFYKLVRMENIGFKNTSRINIWTSPDTTVKPLASKYFHPNKLVFDCYESYDLKNVKENREHHNVLLRSPFIWFMILCLCWAAYTIVSGNFQRTIMKKDVKKKAAVENVEKKEVVENKNEVKINDKCITKISKIRGQSLYYLNDGSAVSNASGLLVCPGN